MMKRWRSMPSAFILHFRKGNGHPIPESDLPSRALKSRRRAVDVLKWQQQPMATPESVVTLITCCLHRITKYTVEKKTDHNLLATSIDAS